MQFMLRSKGMFSQFWDIQSRGSSTNSVRVELKGEVILKLNTINVVCFYFEHIEQFSEITFYLIHCIYFVESSLSTDVFHIQDFEI